MKDQIIINNLLINYYQIGQGRKHVLFLHGWRSNGSVWSQITQKLQDEDLSLYALDLPSFGESPQAKKDLTLGDYTGVVKDFIGKKALGKVTIVGHSFGGRIGIKLAASYPEIVEKLVLVDSAGINLNRQKISFTKFVSKFFKPFFQPKFMQGLRKKIYEKLGAEDYLATPELKNTFLNIINEDLTENLAKINQPTLLIWGANDKETPLEVEKDMRQRIANSQEVILDGAGHFSFMDKPDSFCAAIKTFIKD